MTELECLFCKKIFLNKYVLDKHQKTAKFCIKIQSKNIDDLKENIECKYCKKIFLRKDNFETHLEICKLKKSVINEEIFLKLKDENNVLKIKEFFLNEKIEEQQKLLEEKQNLIEKQYNMIKELQDKLEKTYESNQNRFEKTLESTQNKLIEFSKDVIEKSGTKTYNTNIIGKQKIIQNLLPISNDLIKEQCKNLSLDDMKNEAFSLADFSFNNIFKNRLAITDNSRKILVFKDENGNVIKDENGMKTSNNFIDSSRDHTISVLRQYYSSLDLVPLYNRDNKYYKHSSNIRNMLHVFGNKNIPNDSKFFEPFRKNYINRLIQLINHSDLNENNILTIEPLDEKEVEDEQDQDNEEDNENEIFKFKCKPEEKYIYSERRLIGVALTNYKKYLDYKVDIKNSTGIDYELFELLGNDLCNLDNILPKFEEISSNNNALLFNSKEFKTTLKLSLQNFNKNQEETLKLKYMDEEDCDIINTVLMDL